jgi:hypothetical protein
VHRIDLVDFDGRLRGGEQAESDDAEKSKLVSMFHSGYVYSQKFRECK